MCRRGEALQWMQWKRRCNLLAVDTERLLVAAVRLLVDADARVLSALVARRLDPL